MRIATHNGTFHADEVSAIALLMVFNPEIQVTIDRVQHQTTEFHDYDIVLDTGRQYDKVKYFDHHQWEGGKSSAGLIWEHIQTTQDIIGEYPIIDELVTAIDHNDVGVKPAAQFEYSRLLSLYNSNDIHSPEQYDQFWKAINWAVTILKSLKDKQSLLDATRDMCTSAPCWKATPDVLLLPEYLHGWNTYVNGVTRPNIEAVVWHDKSLDTWNIQTTNKSPDSYEKVGKKLLPCDAMNFVHANNFLAVASSEELMDNYIKYYRE